MLAFDKEDNILLIDKPAGITSFGVVARVKRQIKEHFGRKIKVGHTGTLDPFATGLMIILTGKQTKNAMDYSKLDKVYQATIRLGQISTTGDPEGEISSVSDKIPTENELEGALEPFRGEITQIPPIYSAIKIGGQRAYKLARRGEIPEIPERKVTIYKLELVSYSYPEVRLRAHVSSGTYIRTLAEDIGKRLGTGAYCLELRRTKVGRWTIEEAQPIILD